MKQAPCKFRPGPLEALDLALGPRTGPVRGPGADQAATECAAILAALSEIAANDAAPMSRPTRMN